MKEKSKIVEITIDEEDLEIIKDSLIFLSLSMDEEIEEMERLLNGSVDDFLKTKLRYLVALKKQKRITELLLKMLRIKDF